MVTQRLQTYCELFCKSYSYSYPLAFACMFVLALIPMPWRPLASRVISNFVSVICCLQQSWQGAHCTLCPMNHPSFPGYWVSFSMSWVKCNLFQKYSLILYSPLCSPLYVYASSTKIYQYCHEISILLEHVVTDLEGRNPRPLRFLT